MNAVDEEHSQAEVTDNSCEVDCIEIVSKDGGNSCSSDCVSGDWSAEIKQEILAAVKKEPDCVCCVIIL